MSACFICLTICSFAVIAVIATIYWLWRRDAENFRDKWPAIDDEEFRRRCSPGTDRETALKVRRIISKHLNIPYQQIHPQQSFIDDFDV